MQESQAEQQGAELGERAGGAPVGRWACRGRGAGSKKRPRTVLMWQWAQREPARGAPCAAAARAGRDAGRGRGGASGHGAAAPGPRGLRGPGAPRGGPGQGRKPLRRGPGICRFHPCLFRREPSASSFLEGGRLKNAMYNVAIHKPGLAKDWGSLYGGCYVENCRDRA